MEFIMFINLCNKKVFNPIVITLDKNHHKTEVQMRYLILALLLLVPTLSQAQTVNSLSILDTLKTLPLKEGFTYDFTHKRGLNTLGLGLIGYGPVALDLSWIGVDGLGATLDYNLSNLPVKNVPVLNYVQYLNIGYTIGLRTLALNPATDNPKSDNQLIQGPTVFLKFKF